MHFKKHFRVILESHYPDRYQQLMNRIEERFTYISMDTRFAARSKNPMDKRLDFSAYFLSLIQVLEKENKSYEEIRNVAVAIAYELIRPKNKLERWLKRILALLVHQPLVRPLLKMLDKKLGQKGHQDGFRARIITDKEQTYGFGYGIDILECGICKLFHKHHAGKYTSILCEVDKITSHLAGLELIRSGTIANGAQICDFRFKKKSY